MNQSVVSGCVFGRCATTLVSVLLLLACACSGAMADEQKVDLGTLTCASGATSAPAEIEGLSLSRLWEVECFFQPFPGGARESYSGTLQALPSPEPTRLGVAMWTVKGPGARGGDAALLEQTFAPDGPIQIGKAGALTGDAARGITLLSITSSSLVPHNVEARPVYLLLTLTLTATHS
jgi:hypothetical protein